MPSTKAEIRDRAAEELGVLRLGQALQHQDQVRIEKGYDEVYAELKSDGIVAWASTASVPDEYVPPMAFLVALNCSGVYGLSQERFARIVAKAGLDGELAKRDIRKFIRPHHELTDEATDY